MGDLKQWALDHMGYTLSVGDKDFTLHRLTDDGRAVLTDGDGAVRRMALREVRSRFVRQNLSHAAEGGWL
jgi:hypothetical protein